MRSTLLISFALILSLQICLISTQTPTADSYLGTWSKLTIYRNFGSSCCIPSAVNIWSEDSKLKMSFETYPTGSPNYSSKCYFWSGSYSLYPNADKPGEYYMQKQDASYFSIRNYHFSILNGTTLGFQAGNLTGTTQAQNDCVFTMSTQGSLGGGGTSWGFIVFIVVIIALVGWKKHQKKQQEIIAKQNEAQPSTNPSPAVNNNFAYNPNPVYVAPQMYVGYPNQQFVQGYPQPQMGYVAAQPQPQVQPQVQAQANPQVAVNVNANAGAAQGSNEFNPANGGIAAL